VIPDRVVLMGVSGTGKSALGRRLATQIGAAFIEADDFHSDANKRLMFSSTPLTDADRWPWLDAVAVAISTDEKSVTACSALKRSYRDRLRQDLPELFFIELDGTRELLAARLEDRRAHFMPSSLLESQFATLEPLESDEAGFRVDVAPMLDRLVTTIISELEAP
jgi:gluconokinase